VKITTGKVVSIEFKIADANGTILDQSEQDNEWTFLTGSGEIPTGLEEALDGKEVGNNFKVTLTPENGYGARNEDLVTTIAKSDLGEEDVSLGVGDQLEAETEEGWEIVTVVAINADSITVDGNHEFAGKTVSFDVTITEVRDATPEELEHGHVHDGECEDGEDWDEFEEEFDEEFEEEEEEEEEEKGKKA
jgi:FKBP-type peptidyl-prolyl cis-trans isomerase SlyD